jgi:hypothetical protein
MRALILAAGLLLATAPLAAQARPNTREGFWIGFGLGIGSTGAECQNCGNDRVSGASGYLRLGGTVSPNVLLGGESTAWAHTDGLVEESLAFATFTALFYPSRTGAFYLKLGLGGMTYRADDGFDELTATAPAAQFGLGYEFRVSRNMSIVAFLNSLASSSVNIELNGQPAPSDDLQLSLVQLGAGLTWH